MVDLQRPISDNGILFAAGCKTAAEIAIQTLCGVQLQTKILCRDSEREFYSFGFFTNTAVILRSALLRASKDQSSTPVAILRDAALRLLRMTDRGLNTRPAGTVPSS